jgi:hypothetical protein
MEGFMRWLLMTFFVTGCAHVWVEGRDYEKGTISLSRNKFVSDSQLEAEASRRCGGNATLVREERETGPGGSYVDTYGLTRTTSKRFLVYTFKCEEN